MKTFVKVRCDFEFGGRITPLLFRTENGPAVRIDRILDVRPAPVSRLGGQGIRYLCRVNDKTICLFYDEDRWFVEKVLPEMGRA